MKSTLRRLAWGIPGLVALGAVGIVATPLLDFERMEGYFAPIYSADGGSVVFVARRTTGIVWGFGYETFTPPAHSFVIADEFSLRRLDLANGGIEVLRQWPPSPLVGRHTRVYRGGIFHHASVQLDYARDDLVYKVDLGIVAVPLTEHYWIGRGWPGGGGATAEFDTWRNRAFGAGGLGEAVLHDGWEVMAVRGRAGFPAALVAYHQESGAIRVLLANAEYAGLYPSGVTPEHLREMARRPQIERSRLMRRTEGELMARFQAETSNENDVALRTVQEMRRLGFYPKAPTMTARLLDELAAHALAGTDLPLYDITEAEMRSGLFPDIEQAIAEPGMAVERTVGTYVMHQDYANSALLNRHLGAGGQHFLVRHAGRTYEIIIGKN